MGVTKPFGELRGSEEALMAHADFGSGDRPDAVTSNGDETGEGRRRGK